VTTDVGTTMGWAPVVVDVEFIRKIRATIAQCPAHQDISEVALCTSRRTCVGSDCGGKLVYKNREGASAQLLCVEHAAMSPSLGGRVTARIFEKVCNKCGLIHRVGRSLRRSSNGVAVDAPLHVCTCFQMR